MPIAFLFNPSVLASFFRYYPFDTGALADGLFGKAGEPLLPFKETYAVPAEDVSSPARMVYHLYLTNHRYLTGHVNDQLVQMPTPFPQLSTFFNEDLCDYGIDRRQLLIECQSKNSIPLNKGLLWIGFPDSMTDIFARLYDVTKPSVPEYFQYEAHAIFNPAAICERLEFKAAEVVRRFEELPGMRGT
ncbi:MAG TPA: hypothetical protein VJM50_17065 [Pyrinomonadaceae bacterium]|nr:hypothetical protein [Pyrinomonadaceae bacterium]